MHLDTVFTMVDFDKFTIHPEIEGPLQLFEITLDREGNAHFSSIQDELENILKIELGLPAVDLIRCGGDDRSGCAEGTVERRIQYAGHSSGSCGDV